MGNCSAPRRVANHSPIKHGRSVMQELTNYVDEYTKLVMDCIKEMVKNVDMATKLHVWKTLLKKLLAQLLRKEVPIAKRARELMQYISRKSYHLMKEFKPLLDQLNFD